MIETTIRAVCDLERGVNRTQMGMLFAAGDALAHRVEVTVRRGGLAVGLEGASVSGYLIRMRDQATVMLKGEVADSVRGVIALTLSENCYAQPGAFALAIRLMQGETRETVFYGVGTVSRTATDSLVDVEQKVPSLDALLSQIGRIETAVSLAQQASEESRAETNMAHQAADRADEAQVRAQTAALLIEGMTTTAQQVHSLARPEARVTTVNGHYNIDFSIPAGIVPRLNFVVETGEPGTEATCLGVSGSTEMPIVHLRIPRGDTGNVENLTINGQKIKNGSITLTPEHIGALTAQQAVQAAYPVGSIYLTVSDADPATLFGGTWKRLGGRFLLGADETYPAGSTGGEAEHVLTAAEQPNVTGQVQFRKQTNSGNIVAAHPDYSQNGCFTWTENTGAKWGTALMFSSNDSQTNNDVVTFDNGGQGAAHNNMPPYLAVYMWQRTA